MQTCTKHNIELECLAGHSAHPDNWYCPECDREAEEAKANDAVASPNERVVTLPEASEMLGCPNCAWTVGKKKAESMPYTAVCPGCLKTYVRDFEPVEAM